MSSQALKVFGSVLLIVALIGFTSLPGQWMPSLSTKTSPQLTKIENKSYSNTVTSTQAYFSKYLVKNQYIPVVPDDPNSEWINAHIMEGRDPSSNNPGISDTTTGSTPGEGFEAFEGCRDGRRGCFYW